MIKTGEKVLHWAPRVLGILFAVFISVFALDVFGEGYGFWETIGALLIHLVPTYLIVGAVLLGWRWKWPGGVLFIGLAVFYIVMTRGRMDWVVYLLIPAPAALIGILFLVDWFRKRSRSIDADDD
ncbi:MAG: hypothetical protein K8R77_02035 [Anaerolineaceae bacterium]|nr:hypothetical protein [Anaerolineaceae bacterium]